jgi:cytochrome c biogenesis protein CcmG/thiol:disulfide interchange protein DsbE
VLSAVVVVVVGLLLGLLGWRILDRQEGTGIANAALAGERPAAPDFTLPELDGEGEITLSSYRGRVVVLNVWASWCPPCKDEAPALQDAWERWRDDGVVVLGLNAQDLSGDARAFVSEHEITYPNVRDGGTATPGKFGVVAFPETLFIDADGRIAVYRPGPVDAEMIESGIETALRS